MRFSFSNLLAVSSILVWATAWAATERNLSANAMSNAPGSISAATKMNPAADLNTSQVSLSKQAH